MSETKSDVKSDCAFDYHREISRIDQPLHYNPHVHFQPWLATYQPMTYDEKPDAAYQPMTYDEKPDIEELRLSVNYNTSRHFFDHQNFSKYDHFIPALYKTDEDNMLPRPASVLSSTSTSSTATNSTTSSSSSEAESLHSNMESRLETDPSKTSKNTTVDNRKKTRAEKYRRYPKPPYSYCGLIITAIQNSPNQRLTLSGILNKLMELFEFFRGSYTGWRDCVRHNLSHNACFYKVPYPLPGEDEITGKKSSGRNYWKVDLSLAPKHVFKIINKKAAKSGQHKTYIHEELGLPEILIPNATLQQETSPNLTMINNQFSQDFESMNQFVKKTHSTGRPRYNMRLPNMARSSCYSSNDSPEQFRQRDSIIYDTVTPSKTEENYHHSPTAKRQRITGSFDCMDVRKSTEMEQIFDYVKSLTSAESLSSTEAVNNLSSLC